MFSKLVKNGKALSTLATSLGDCRRIRRQIVAVYGDCSRQCGQGLRLWKVQEPLNQCLRISIKDNFKSRGQRSLTAMRWRIRKHKQKIHKLDNVVYCHKDSADCPSLTELNAFKFKRLQCIRTRKGTQLVPCKNTALPILFKITV